MAQVNIRTHKLLFLKYEKKFVTASLRYFSNIPIRLAALILWQNIFSGSNPDAHIFHVSTYSMSHDHCVIQFSLLFCHRFCKLYRSLNSMTGASWRSSFNKQFFLQRDIGVSMSRNLINDSMYCQYIAPHEIPVEDRSVIRNNANFSPSHSYISFPFPACFEITGTGLSIFSEYLLLVIQHKFSV